MYYYRIAEVVLQSCYRLMSFDAFACEAARADITLDMTDELPPLGPDQLLGIMYLRQLDDGWFFHFQDSAEKGLYVSADYTRLHMLGIVKPAIERMDEWFVRVAVECMLARKGCVSLHAAAVEAEGEAFAFTGPSGAGKSTRANAMMDELGAKMISGDRPLIDVKHLELYGVPWDGEEQCFRNVHYPLKAICEVRRAESVYVRAMSFAQRRKLLMRQCFLPMWDTETAVIQMANISRLAAGANIVRVFSGPTGEDVRVLYNALQEHQVLKEKTDLKTKAGFTLRNVKDETILIPIGDNIRKFNGTVLLNEVSALVWKKMQTPVSRDDLLKAILDEYEVEEAAAAADLDALLEKLKGFGVIEED